MEKEIINKVTEEFENKFYNEVEDTIFKMFDEYKEVIVTIQVKNGRFFKGTMSEKDAMILRSRLHRKIMKPKYISLYNRFNDSHEDILVKEIIGVNYGKAKLVTKKMMEDEDKLLYDIHLEMHGDDLWLNKRSTAEMNNILEQYNDRTKCVLNVRINSDKVRGINRSRIKDITVKVSK